MQEIFSSGKQSPVRAQIIPDAENHSCGCAEIHSSNQDSAGARSRNEVSMAGTECVQSYKNGRNRRFPWCVFPSGEEDHEKSEPQDLNGRESEEISAVHKGEIAEGFSASQKKDSKHHKEGFPGVAGGCITGFPQGVDGVQKQQIADKSTDADGKALDLCQDQAIGSGQERQNQNRQK